MGKKVADFISALFHPLLMPTIVTALVIFLSPIVLVPNNMLLKMWIVGFIFFSTFIVPSVCMFIMYKAEIISSMTIKDRKERLAPFAFTAIIYIGVTYLLYTHESISEKLAFMMGIIAFLVCVVAVITLFYKISAHSVGMAGVLGMLAEFNMHTFGNIFFWPFIIAIAISGIVMTARLYLKAHRPGEVYSGFIVGFCVSFAFSALLIN